MFRLRNPETKFPELYPKVERKPYTSKEKGWDKVGDFLIRENIDLIPNVGLQENLIACESNLIFVCGEATSGKTFGMMQRLLRGVGRPDYTGRLINVRLTDSKKGTSMFRDAMRVWGNFAGCDVTSSESPTFTWPEWNNSIQMIHANFNADNPSEWADFQEYIKKQQAAEIDIDEATAIEQFKMFTYIFSRNRDNSGVNPCMVLAFNPKHVHWTTEFLKIAGYIGDDWYLKPEMVGKTRYFYIQGDSPSDVIWGDSKEEVARAAKIKLNEEDIDAGLTPEDMVKAFTLFTGHASGNRKLTYATRGQSVANLHNVGATQRAVLAQGYFGPIEEEELKVTKKMIRDLTTNPENDDENMYATMDVSAGGEKSDGCPMVIWKGLKIVAIEMFKGTPKELVDWIYNKLELYNVPITNFAFDATGIGNYLKSFTSGWGITPNKSVMQEYDEQGNPVTLELYYNLRSQLLGKMKVLFEMGKISTSLDLDMHIPYGKKGGTRRIADILFDEINVFIVTTKNKKIYYRSKDEYKARFKASPDLMDAIILRAVFELDARPKKQPSAEIDDDAYLGMYKSYNTKVVYI